MLDMALTSSARLSAGQMCQGEGTKLLEIAHQEAGLRYSSL
jgi:hypothetical protein